MSRELVSLLPHEHAGCGSQLRRRHCQAGRPVPACRSPSPAPPGPRSAKASTCAAAWAATVVARTGVARWRVDAAPGQLGKNQRPGWVALRLRQVDAPQARGDAGLHERADDPDGLIGVDRQVRQPQAQELGCLCRRLVPDEHDESQGGPPAGGQRAAAPGPPGPDRVARPDRVSKSATMAATGPRAADEQGSSTTAGRGGAHRHRHPAPRAMLWRVPASAAGAAPASRPRSASDGKSTSTPAAASSVMIRSVTAGCTPSSLASATSWSRSRLPSSSRITSAARLIPEMATARRGSMPIWTVSRSRHNGSNPDLNAGLTAASVPRPADIPAGAIRRQVPVPRPIAKSPGARLVAPLPRKRRVGLGPGTPGLRS